MIIDDVLFGTHLTQKERFREWIRAATFIKVQNIADYQEELSLWALGDLPIVMPPWRQWWMEWRNKRGGYAWGGQIEAQDDRVVTVLVQAYFVPPIKRAQFVSASARYMIQRSNGQFCPIFPSGEVGFAGSLSPIDAIGFGMIDSSRDLGNPLRRTLDPEWLYLMARYVARVGFLAIAFCHAKNVALQQEVVPRNIRKARERRSRAPVMSYYTLEIAPITARLKTACTDQSVGLGQRLHLCRGHFKDYREGLGLFGRHRGLYWWEMQARGDPKKGEIRKDYEIKSAETREVHS